MFPSDAHRSTDGAIDAPIDEAVVELAKGRASAGAMAGPTSGSVADVLASHVSGIFSIRQARLDTLTPRERDVLAYLLAGAANKVVAIELGISMRTVEAHRAHILRKLGVRNVMALACCLCPHRAAASGGTD